jgi:hypothetical protein
MSLAEVRFFAEVGWLAELGIGLAVLFGMFVVVPWAMTRWVKSLYGGKPRGKATMALGNALQDLDRLVARPSVELKLEAEITVHEEDEKGGD